MEEISIDEAIVAVLSEFYAILTIKEEQTAALNAFLDGQLVFSYS